MQLKKRLFHFITAVALTSPIVACSAFDNISSRLSDDDDAADGDCTLTQGYWKNHPEAWPVASLTLGTVTYTKEELIAILKTPVKGNGLVQLAHQLIAAKLNIAAGADDADISASITAADALIGSLRVGTDSLDTSVTSALNGKLDAFNNGATGPGHCDDDDDDDDDNDCDHDNDGDCDDDCDHDDDGDCDGDDEDCDHDTDGDGTCDPAPVCGNGTLETGEHCDDGNVVSGDGCSATCDCEEVTPPPAPVCGNGTKETGEECDDGNTTAGDGCSATCTNEPIGPVCGNGIMEGLEGCDDGNTIDGDGCSATCVCEPIL